MCSAPENVHSCVNHQHKLNVLILPGVPISTGDKLAILFPAEMNAGDPSSINNHFSMFIMQCSFHIRVK